jgi:hypothetical protein
LDTNVISETVRTSPDRKVSNWLASRPSDDFAISIVTLAELAHGVRMLGDRVRQAKFDDWLAERIMPNFGGRTLQLTLNVLVDWVGLAQRLGAKGRPRASADLLIASTARVYALIVVTRNVRDFADTGVIVYDPWTGKTHPMDAP